MGVNTGREPHQPGVSTGREQLGVRPHLPRSARFSIDPLIDSLDLVLDLVHIRL